MAPPDPQGLLLNKNFPFYYVIELFHVNFRVFFFGPMVTGKKIVEIRMGFLMLIERH
jgi:hypothetical protein